MTLNDWLKLVAWVSMILLTNLYGYRGGNTDGWQFA